MEGPVKIHDDGGMPRGIPNHARPVQGSRPDPNSDSQAIKRPTEDRVEVSDRARALLVAKEALSQASPVRAEKVEALKNLVQAGAYRVPGEKVAARMLGEGLFA